MDSARKEFDAIFNDWINDVSWTDIYQNIYSRYHEYLSQLDRVNEQYDVFDAFKPPKTPESVRRIGRLIWHNPFLSNKPGTLFGLRDFFGSDYDYLGQTEVKLNAWERVDPLFF